MRERVQFEDFNEKWKAHVRQSESLRMHNGIAPPWFHELEQSGASVSWEWKDCIYFVNILYQMGIDADVKIFPFTKQLRYASKEELLARECGKLKAGHYDPKAAEEILLKHFQQNDQGEFTVAGDILRSQFEYVA